MMKILLFPAGLCLLATACSPSLTRINLDDTPPKIFMEKGACLGNCAVYRLNVYENGIVSYEGIQNTDRQGLHYKRLDKSVMEELLADFRRANLWQYEDVYRSAHDQQSQTVSITFYDQGGMKKIMGKSGRPTGVLALENQLDALAEAGDWVARAQETAEAPSEMVIHLREGTEAKAWAQQYRDNKLEVVENYGSGENYWLVRFDPATTTGSKLMQRMRRDASVVGAEWRR